MHFFKYILRSNHNVRNKYTYESQAFLFELLRLYMSEYFREQQSISKILVNFNLIHEYILEEPFKMSHLRTLR